MYMRGAPIKGALVESLLKDVSLVPTVNSFVDRLSLLDFNLFPAIVVDLLHEFELGTLKAVMIHLMWLLFAVDPQKIDIINEGIVFQLIPSFGKGSIQWFPKNVSSMKQQVAWHFEDVLQVSPSHAQIGCILTNLFIPVHNTSV
ncbi:hypothetical protein DFJ58DRAFT_671044 [Suillus subalutaceus]|uniref:uncharacterized protein n=1 Tax=Suillus subalutaceus TaxID=48586 RepID=UPI001B862604|nr:uncharacterized protein DFJ58DRAFT_671044 [Suillus subalutaceus]KAG1832626.1 hypothetical protein DFJ58DRAFT_671044 [Suillus subalutaceus]